MFFCFVHGIWKTFSPELKRGLKVQKLRLDHINLADAKSNPTANYFFSPFTIAIL